MSLYLPSSTVFTLILIIVLHSSLSVSQGRSCSHHVYTCIDSIVSMVHAMCVCDTVHIQVVVGGRLCRGLTMYMYELLFALFSFC